MGKSSPKTPDYVGAAEADVQGQKDLAEYNTQANRPDVITPWGRQTWSRSPELNKTGYDSALATWQREVDLRGGADSKNGIKWANKNRKPMESDYTSDNWTMNLELDPDQQAALDSQMAIQRGRSDTAQGMLGRINDSFGKEFDYESLPSRSGQITARQTSANPFGFGSSDTYRQKAQDAVYNFQKPMLDANRQAVEAQLANQGLARGSEAWNNEMRRVDDSEARAQLQAIDSGRAEAAQNFNQDLSRGNFDQTQATQDVMRQIQAGGFNNQNRQSAISEEQSRRSQALNELNALLSGSQVEQPNMPGFSGAAQAGGGSMSDALSKQYQGDLAASNAENAQTSQAAQLGAMMYMMYMFSDARLKEDIRYTGDFIGSIPVVEFRYRGVPGLLTGVIAQDVLKVKPSAVIVDHSGFYKVNYSELV
jgi:hypothetical protein